MRKLEDKDTPECQFCIYSSRGSIARVTCHANAPIVRVNSAAYDKALWPEVDEKDFCGKWRGVRKSYEDLFPRGQENG